MTLAKLIPMNGWIVLITYILINSTYGLEWLAAAVPADNLFAGPIRTLLTSRGLATFVCAIFFIFSLKPVWRKIWATRVIGGILSKSIFPDLNGDWEFTISSNWPIIEQLRDGATIQDDSEAQGDEYSDSADLQDLHFRATIDQSWLRTKITVDPNSDSPMFRSRSLFVELMKENEAEGKRIAWTFIQANSLPAASTDSRDFFGSAVLILDDGFNSMDGEYWTNRSWEKGMNTAGLIFARRL